MTKKKLIPLNKGQAMITAVMFFLVISVTIVLGISGPLIRQIKTGYETYNSKESYYLAEASIEDVVYRLRTNKQVSSTETLTLNGGSVSSVVATTPTGKEITATANKNSDYRKLKTAVVLGTGVSFHYGVQAGQGGFTLNNSSSITGNVFASGPIIGNSTNYIYGDIVSAGSSGWVYGIHATGSVYSHTIGKSGSPTLIDRNAYYQAITNSTVSGTTYPGSADQAVADLPISDEQIADWEAQAGAGGVMTSAECDSYNSSSNTCTISTTKSIGPKKIPFNLLIKSSSGVLTITGYVWVTGNITAQTGPTIKISSALGSQNVAIIADNPTDSTGSGIIDIGQSTIFQNSGSSGSFIFMISQNNSAETGGSTNAINLNQGASAMVAYASHGQINLGQSVSIKEATAYRITLSQSANVVYDRGLPSTLFSTGPSGGYEIQSWKEIQ